MMMIYGDAIMEQMKQIDMGWDQEVEFVAEVHRMEMFSLAYAFTPDEARILAEVGCPAISSHVGSTVGGMKGAKSNLTLDEATELSQRIFDDTVLIVKKSASFSCDIISRTLEISVLLV